MGSKPARAARGRGRPPIPEADRKRANLTFRTRSGMREKLEAAAAQSGRSVSEEVEYRLERSFQQAESIADILGGVATANLLLLISMAIQEVEKATGKSWREDAGTYDRMKLAAIYILNEAPRPDEATKTPTNLSEMSVLYFRSRLAVAEAEAAARKALEEALKSEDE
jgi:Arc-like DNA binding domain